MEIITQEYAQEYLTFKKELDTELNKAADGFVKIGYLLRRAEDTDVLATSGYGNVSEFAAAEYGLTKDVVSRYININKRFSEGGYSDHLADRYHGFGMAKLAEMLTLPGSVADAIPEELSKTEIREIKQEYEAEQKITDIEVAIEAAQTAGDQGNTCRDGDLQVVLRQYLHDVPDDFDAICKQMTAQNSTLQTLRDIMIPNEARVIIVRIVGKGRIMATCGKEEVNLVNMRTGEKEAHTWEDVYEEMTEILKDFDTSQTVEAIYREIFKEPYPLAEIPKEAAPKEEEKPKKRKGSKVAKAKVAPVQPKKAEKPAETLGNSGDLSEEPTESVNHTEIMLEPTETMPELQAAQTAGDQGNACRERTWTAERKDGRGEVTGTYLRRDEDAYIIPDDFKIKIFGRTPEFASALIHLHEVKPETVREIEKEA